MKPISRKKLIEIIENYQCIYPFVHKNDKTYIGDNAIALADTILKEWGKE